MKLQRTHNGYRCLARRAWALAVGAMLCTGVLSQTVYRSVGPDGRVTYSDRPLAQQSNPVKAPGSSAPAPTGTALPFALQQVVNRYPVTLYTGKNCAPCDAGRALLNARGIPFQEKTVHTPADTKVFAQLNPDNTLPFLTIGGQKIQGLADREWHSYLDAAGYPTTSTLGPNHRMPPAQPLVPLPPATDTAQPTEAAPASPPPPASAVPERNRSNPAGIQF